MNKATVVDCKKCTVCKESLNSSNFNKDKSRVDGLDATCKICKKKQKNRFYKNNKTLVLERNLKWKKENKEKNKETNKQYSLNNRDKINKLMNEWKKRQRNNRNMQYILKESLRSRTRSAIKGLAKTGSAIRDLGCSVDELKTHLENNFYMRQKTGEMMTWDNYGFYGWHIDHIKPLSSFDLSDRVQFLEAANYKNLQPLWAEENFKKGDKYDKD